MDAALDPPARPIRWLAASDILWLLGGVVAYATAIDLTLLTAVALAPALRGLSELKRSTQGEQARVWTDRALTFAAGTLGLVAILILIPYAASGTGISLWSSVHYANLGVVVSATGMLLWNAAVFQGLAQWDDVRSVRLYAAFHAVLILAAWWLAFNGDAQAGSMMLRGETFPRIDLQAAPAMAAAPGLLWALVMWRAGQGKAQAK